MQFLEEGRSENGYAPDVAETYTYFAPDPSTVARDHRHSFWTRHEVDTALNDLARHGFVRIISNQLTMEIEILRPWSDRHE